MSDNTNVIAFPKAHVKLDKEPTVDDIHHNIDMMKQYHIQETILNIVPMVFNQLDIAGFGLAEDEEEDIRDGALIVEALRSIMSKYYGIYHPFQRISDHIFIEQQEGVFKIVDELKINLREEADADNVE